MDRYLFVAAIDFGTAYSGFAYSTRGDFADDPLKISFKIWGSGTCALLSQKTPTCALFDADKKFHSFGFEAEDKYSDLTLDKKHQEWYFFKRFKMMLYDKMTLKRRLLLEEELGKKMPALDVFSASIRSLKEGMMAACRKSMGNDIRDHEVRWVLTVPAIWNDAAKQFMREAAEQAGICGDDLLIALEPEAASLFCHHLPLGSFAETGKGKGFTPLQPGSKYLVFDAGGGTVDITAHEVLPSRKIKELYKATGGNWGGTYVDQAFRDLLADIVGNNVVDAFAESNTADFTDLFRDFEVKKRNFKSDMSEKVTVNLPISFLEECRKATGKEVETVLKQHKKYAGKIQLFGHNKLRLAPETAIALFKASCESVADHLQELFGKRELQGVATVLMVGGFSESPVLQAAVRKCLPDKKIVIPEDASLAVLKGAVIFGHAQDTIAERKCRYTYGVQTSTRFDPKIHPESKKFKDDEGNVLCGGIFGKHIEIGQTVVCGEAQVELSYNPTSKSTTSLNFKVYASTETDPLLVTEPGSQKLGTLAVELHQEGGLERTVKIRMTFSGTELEVSATECETGKETTAKFEFLG